MQENKTLDEIGMELDLSCRTLFYWKRNTTGTNEKFEYEHEKDSFSQELLELARKMMRKLNSDLDKIRTQTNLRFIRFMNILKKHPVAQRIRSIYFPNQTKTTKLSHPPNKSAKSNEKFWGWNKALHSLVFT